MRTILCLLAMLALGACGSDKQDDTTATHAPPAGTVVVPKNNVFSPLVNDLNKAKQVNNTVQQQFQKGDKQLESDSAAPAPATTQAP